MTQSRDVFINCPFDEDYQRHFRALVFCLHYCGARPRSALEVEDGSEVRIGRILRIIGESPYGIHDLSRTEPDPATALPRFNMPLELGLFLGAKHFGGPRQRLKACIILDRDRYRYQRFCSDIAGLDIRAHGDDEAQLIRGVRDALRSWHPERELPGGALIYQRYLEFTERLPRLAAEVGLEVQELTFGDLSALVTEWLRIDAPASGPS
jgi:hypothetical protein